MIKLKERMNKIKAKAGQIWGAIVTFAITMQCKMATAAEIPTNVTPETFSQKLVDLIAKYGTPIGGAIIFGAIVFGGIKLITQAYQAEERARTMGGFWYVLIGSVLVGGALFFAGMFVGLGQEFAK